MSFRQLARLRLRARNLLACGLSAAFVCSTPVVRAESGAGPGSKLYGYRRAAKPHYLRAAVEEFVIVGGEALQYWKDRQINSEDLD